MLKYFASKILFQNRRKQRSKVWQKFLTDGELAVCKECNQVIRHSGSTSNLLHHLKVHEMKQEKEDAAPMEHLDEIVFYEEDERDLKKVEGESSFFV